MLGCLLRVLLNVEEGLLGCWCVLGYSYVRVYGLFVC